MPHHLFSFLGSCGLRIGVLVGLLGLVACTFDSTALDQRRCATDTECPSGTCVDGYCMFSGDSGWGIGDVDAAQPRDDVDTGAPLDIDANVDIEEVDLGGDSTVDPCLTGELYCDGHEVVQCDERGTVTLIESCLDPAVCDQDVGCVCQDGACVSRACAPGHVRCASELGTEQCNDAGTGYEAASMCEGGALCAAGECREVECPANEEFCEGEVAVRCDENGAVSDFVDCGDEGWLCSRVEEGVGCVSPLCTPGEVRCASDTADFEGDALVTCNARGSAYVLSGTCDSPTTCFDGECRSLRCEPNARVCHDGRTVRECNATGTAQNEERCGVTSYCDQATATCQPRVCEPGAIRCTEAGVEECTTFGADWLLFAPCAVNERCVNERCISTVCPAGETYCEGDVARKCSEDGTAVLESETCPFTCEAGACVDSFCGDGVVDSGRGEACDDANDDPCDGCDACQLRRALNLGPGVFTDDGARWLPNQSNFTMEAWVNTNSTTGTIMGISGVGERDGVRVYLVDGAPALEMRLDTGRVVRVFSRVSISGAGWTHVAFVRFDVDGGAIYVNGDLVGFHREDVGRRGIDDMTGRIWLGSDGTSTSVVGQIDEVRISSVVRYTANFTPRLRHTSDDVTIALYHLDEGVGENAISASGSRDLLIRNATWSDPGCYGGTAASITCGDGVVAPWEECDPGSPPDIAACGTDCRLPSPCRHGLAFDDGSSDGGCYLVLNQPMEWTDARDLCRL